MNNTESSFRAKWENNNSLAVGETLREGSDIFNWILGRNGYESVAQFSGFLQNKKRILDAGCGNGRVSALLRKYSDADRTEIVGIDLVAAEIASNNLEKLGLEKNTSFYEKDLLADLTDLGQFDYIYCQEVLHHTSDPQQAFLNLCRLLLPSGEIAIYVYKQKAPIREYADDYIRDRISELPYEEALQVCDQITNLGKMLSEQNVKISVPDVEILDIKAGEYDLQRFIYHYFMKCFWNEHLSFTDNSVINYDWYHPQLSTRHTVEEVRQWFHRAGLRIIHESVDFYGITVRGVHA